MYAHESALAVLHNCRLNMEGRTVSKQIIVKLRGMLAVHERVTREALQQFVGAISDSEFPKIVCMLCPNINRNHISSLKSMSIRKVLRLIPFSLQLYGKLLKKTLNKNYSELR